MSPQRQAMDLDLDSAALIICVTVNYVFLSNFREKKQFRIKTAS